MSQIKYKTCILAAIDQLRFRKARPDLNRICNFMLKCYKVAPKDTKADLIRCVKEKVIIKVDYKNNVSYRNAANWRKNRKQAPKEIKQMTTLPGNGEKRIITSAIATLIYQDQNYLEKGVSFDELTKAAANQSSKYSRKQLEGIIHGEISSGSLVRLPGGNLALGPADHDADSVDSIKSEYNADSNTKMTSSANSSCRSSPLRMRGRPRKGTSTKSAPSSLPRSTAVRVGERRKMAKKVFDPSDNNLPSKRKRGRPVGSLNKSTLRLRRLDSKNENNSTKDTESQGSEGEVSGDDLEPEETSLNETSGGVCSVCLVQKPRGSNDRLVECRDCSNKAHSSCLQSGAGMLKLRPDNTWQCPHCKTCVVCCETNDAGVLTVCSVCSDAYHALCHSPRIPERLKAWDQWECNNCLESRPTVAEPTAQIVQHTQQQAPKLVTIDPFLKPHELDMSKSKIGREIPIDESIPDISDWSSEDVFDYFQEHFPDAAPIFKDQDIDGQALSVARRKDIVKGLGLPLGPALRVYRIVVKLQTRKDDFSLCWG